MTAVVIPQPGQTVLLDARTGPQFAARTIRLRLTRPVEPYAPDAGTLSQSSGAARWWILTGSRLGPDDEPLGLCTVTIRATTLRIEPRPPAVSWSP
ncbi:MAG: hypothetical protein WCA46_25250 [Actinocatenispora sp.]